jgi:hypothetical protein
VADSCEEPAARKQRAQPEEAGRARRNDKQGRREYAQGPSRHTRRATGALTAGVRSRAGALAQLETTAADLAEALQRLRAGEAARAAAADAAAGAAAAQADLAAARGHLAEQAAAAADAAAAAAAAEQRRAGAEAEAARARAEAQVAPRHALGHSRAQHWRARVERVLHRVIDRRRGTGSRRCLTEKVNHTK